MGAATQEHSQYPGQITRIRRVEIDTNIAVSALVFRGRTLITGDENPLALVSASRISILTPAEFRDLP